MKKIIFPFVIVLFWSSLTVAQERTWKTFSPNTGAFSILAPGNLSADSEAMKVPSDKGSYSFTDSTGFFAVIYRDSPKRFVPWKPNYKAYYKKIRDDAVKAVTGELLSDVEFTNGGMSGREFMVKLPNLKIADRESQTRITYRIERARIFFVGKRFYILFVVLPEDQINSAEVNQFMNSFTPKQP